MTRRGETRGRVQGDKEGKVTRGKVQGMEGGRVTRGRVQGDKKGRDKGESAR